MFDRMIFRGHLTRLFPPGAISAMLWQLGFPLTEFTRYAMTATEQLTATAKRLAADAGRPYIYSERSRRRDGDPTKEEFARAIADRDGITERVVCVVSVVEPVGAGISSGLLTWGFAPGTRTAGCLAPSTT